MQLFISLVFVVGYIFIAFEHPLRVNKSATAILTGVLIWVLLALNADSLLWLAPAAGHATGTQLVLAELSHHLAEIAEILFFLMGAMTIVELIDVHDGFAVITQKITTTHTVKLLWIMGLFTFFLSAILDNLTTTIVMVSLLRGLVADKKMRWFFVGIVIIAANAGGAWSPIGDVTTTMLWIGNQVTALSIMKQLIVPSIMCLLAPLLLLTMTMKGSVTRAAATAETSALATYSPRERLVVFCVGLSGLVFVPIFKTLTHLPPYMGVLLALSVLWVVTERMHRDKSDDEKHGLTVSGVIQRIDTASILFFLGILLAVSGLATAGQLAHVGAFLTNKLGNVFGINLVIGLLSAVIDNVPLVAGAMKMYPITPGTLPAADMLAASSSQQQWLSHFVQDGYFWEMLAYCAGTGGSCLIIGSAAGVAAMGMEKIDFMWYLKKISWLALLGYLAGAGVYMLQETWFSLH